MFIWPDGTVTGSIRWGELEEIVAARSDENVTDEGWARLDSLLTERAGASTDSAESEPEEDQYASQTVAELRTLLNERDLPTSGNKADLVERLHEDDAKPDEVVSEPEDDTPEEE